MSVEELPTLIIVVVLTMVFLGSIAHSYDVYNERKGEIERFEAGLDFADLLKNNLLAARINGVPNPGLVDRTGIQDYGFADLHRHWYKGYNWEVVISDCSGEKVYERGFLKNDGISVDDQGWRETTDDITIVYSNVAVMNPDGSVKAARLEVYVW